MPKMHLVAELNTDYLERLIAALPDRCGRIARHTAEEIRDTAQDYSAVVTGAQQASVYVVTSDESTYDEAVAAARAANPDVELLPEVEAPPPGVAVVAVAVVYGASNEFDHQAFLGPAAEDVRPRYEAALSHLEDELRDA